MIDRRDCIRKKSREIVFLQWIPLQCRHDQMRCQNRFHVLRKFPGPPSFHTCRQYIRQTYPHVKPSPEEYTEVLTASPLPSFRKILSSMQPLPVHLSFLIHPLRYFQKNLSFFPRLLLCFFSVPGTGSKQHRSVPPYILSLHYSWILQLIDHTFSCSQLVFENIPVPADASPWHGSSLFSAVSCHRQTRKHTDGKPVSASKCTDVFNLLIYHV